MNIKCINLKQKLDRTLYCKYKKSDIKISECSNCIYKEYKAKVVNSRPLKQRTYKLSKAEKNRFSLFTDDLDHCILCGKKRDNLHEVFFGRNRANSIKYGLVIPLCIRCHTEMHKNRQWQDAWHKKGQAKFNEAYPELDFVSIFKKNYLL